MDFVIIASQKQTIDENGLTLSQESKRKRYVNSSIFLKFDYELVIQYYV